MIFLLAFLGAFLGVLCAELVLTYWRSRQVAPAATAVAVDFDELKQRLTSRRKSRRVYNRAGELISGGDDDDGN
jgi:hypothetical protein